MFNKKKSMNPMMRNSRGDTVFYLINGVFLVLVPFLLAFMSDSGAYFAGRFFGRHKLAPIISPNKTVEGMVGGLSIIKNSSAGTGSAI